jgi:hypothetical protein
MPDHAGFRGRCPERRILKIIAPLLVSLLISPTQAREKLIYHEIRTDAKGMIVPWYDKDPGKAYDHVIQLVWQFWDTMRKDPTGLPYYMSHQVWRPDYDDPRGLGGDQLQMALSSWQLLYAYSGNERVKQNMKFIADYYLAHSLSPSDCAWPDLPFPYNTLLYSGIYDGDMVIGKGFLQPDKAGSFGLELVHLYKMTSRDFYLQSTSARYRDAAIRIAQTLSAHIQPGDEEHSPLPFKVNAFTGETGQLKNNNVDGSVVGEAGYTSNWSATMELFLELAELDSPNATTYQKAFDTLLNWMKQYPVRNNRWGPFFEDVQGWSDTQINAVTFARFMMDHPKYFPDWQSEVEAIFKWVYLTLGNENWKRYGVIVVNEQTVYQTPGESHTSREGATELLYCALSHNDTRKTNAIRQLTWATYMVDVDGKNRFPQDENWLTDGYGDYVRHYLRAMAADPALAPSFADHILSSSSIIQQADYQGQANKFLVPYVKPNLAARVRIYYRTFDSSGTEMIRLVRKPATVLLGDKSMLAAGDEEAEGFTWTPLARGGVLRIHRLQGTEVAILD